METTAGIRLIFGQPQSGKTTRVRTLTARFPRVLWYDTACHDYRDGVICYSLPELKGFWRSVYRNRFRIVYRPQGSTREERRLSRKIDPEFDAVCDLVRLCEDMVFAVDEVDRYAERNEYDDAFTDLIRRGEGHYGVDLIVATQFPQGIGRVLTAATRTFDIFQAAEADHIRYFVKRCGGIDPQDIRTLPKYVYIHYEQGADSYWICKDDLRTGGTERTEREYLYDRMWNRGPTPDSGDVVLGPTVGHDCEDGSASLPFARPQGDSSHGRHTGGESGRADPLSASGRGATGT
jgi:hypothetical protein